MNKLQPPMRSVWRNNNSSKSGRMLYGMTQFMDVEREKIFLFFGAVGAMKNAHKSVRAFSAEISFLVDKLKAVKPSHDGAYRWDARDNLNFINKLAKFTELQ